jgi:CHU_C Type IX secretion signal domain
LSFDEQGRISLEAKEVFIETLELGYEVCDPCNPCVSGKLIILNEKLKEITQTTLITPSQSTNNTLQFSSEPIPDSELWIYNRWGQQILHSKNYQNDWDTNGYPGGVYYYVFKVYGVTIKRALTVVK